MVEEFNVPGIQNTFFVHMLPIHSSGAIVRDDESRCAAKEFKCIGVSCIPRGHLFIQESFAVEVSAVKKRHDESMDVNDLAGIKIREVSVIACPVCLPFQTGNMVHCELVYGKNRIIC